MNAASGLLRGALACIEPTGPADFVAAEKTTSDRVLVATSEVGTELAARVNGLDVTPLRRPGEEGLRGLPPSNGS
jgi:hypothetical protein